MARLDKIATSYAKAVYDHLGDAAKVRAVGDELKSFAGVLAENKELSDVLATQRFSEEDRAGVLADLTARLKLSPDASRVLQVLSEMGRLDHVAGVAQKLHLLMLDAAGVVPLHVESSVGLDASEKQKVEQKFQKILGKKVEASYVVDPNLIGGLRVTAAGRTYDGTLSGWLNVFEQKLVGGSI